MYRVDVWVPKYGCFYPGLNIYTKDEALNRARQMRKVGHKVKVVAVDAPKYTEN